MDIFGEDSNRESHMEAIGECANRNMNRLDIFRGGSMCGALPSTLIPPHLRKTSKENVKEASSNDDSKDYVYTVEIVPDENIARMPSMFTKKCSGFVPTHVIFEDPEGNVINLYTFAHGNSIYLTEGWKYLRQYYGLQKGDWVDMVYDGATRFRVRLFAPNRNEINYPPMPESLIADPHTLNISAPRPELSFKFIDYNKFKFRLVKWLTFPELTGDTMTIPRDWAYSELSVVDCDATIIDEYGKKWYVFLKHDINVQDKCGLTRGWAHFCSAKRFKQQQKIVFGVLERHSTELYYLPTS